MKANRYQPAARVVIFMLVSLVVVQVAASGEASPDVVAKHRLDLLLTSLHDAGLQHDRRALPQLLEALRHPYRPVRGTALWALGRLEDPDSVVDLWAFSRDPKTDPDQRHYAAAVAARVEAAERGRATTPAALGRHMRAVLDEVGLTPEDVGDALAEAADGPHPSPRSAAARAALRQIADQALTAANRGLLHGAQATPLTKLAGAEWGAPRGDLTTDVYRTLQAHALKMKLSDFPPGEARIGFLVDELSSRKVLSDPEDFLIQSLVNEGPAAVPAIVAQLEVMRNDREKYAHTAFAGLFRALTGIGGTEAAEAVKSLLSDPQRWVRYYSEQAHE